MWSPRSCRRTKLRFRLRGNDTTADEVLAIYHRPEDRQAEHAFLPVAPAVPYLLLLPAIVVILAVVLVPLLVSFWTSFTGYNLTKPATLFQFVGLRNYQRILTQPRFLVGLRAHRRLHHHRAQSRDAARARAGAAGQPASPSGQRTLRTIMMFPMMFSPILVGFQFKYLFNDEVGLVNNALFACTSSREPIPWLVDGTLAPLSIILAEVWMSTSVFAILLLAGLMAMPKEPMEAAKVDGCNPLAGVPPHHAAVPDALHLHRHDHPLARRGARL